ncbi:hypothetical protein BC830DRAFT_691385 [Chytriomyces sp. MP71]|nr:hypothetical protein BC830DRAFT_691385 [Chytriomyces sp. MP71]
MGSRGGRPRATMRSHLICHPRQEKMNGDASEKTKSATRRNGTDDHCLSLSVARLATAAQFPLSFIRYPAALLHFPTRPTLSNTLKPPMSTIDPYSPQQPNLQVPVSRSAERTRTPA